MRIAIEEVIVRNIYEFEYICSGSTFDSDVADRLKVMRNTHARMHTRTHTLFNCLQWEGIPLEQLGEVCSPAK